MTQFNPLSDDTIRRLCPVAFEESPSAAMSDKYTPLRTIDVVNALRAEDWFPVEASQVMSKYSGARDVAYHVMRLRRPDDLAIRIGDSVLELALTNSLNGRSCYTLSAGLFVLICANGLTIASSVMQSLKVRHSYTAIEEVIEGSIEIVEKLPVIRERVERFQHTTTSQLQREEFSISAIDMIGKSGKIAILDMLTPHRPADSGNTAWKVFNRVQENVIRGGLKSVTRREDGSVFRTMQTKPINNPEQNVRINTGLWERAEEHLLAA